MVKSDMGSTLLLNNFIARCFKIFIKIKKENRLVIDIINRISYKK